MAENEDSPAPSANTRDVTVNGDRYRVIVDEGVPVGNTAGIIVTSDDRVVGTVHFEASGTTLPSQERLLHANIGGDHLVADWSRSPASMTEYLGAPHADMPASVSQHIQATYSPAAVGQGAGMPNTEIFSGGNVVDGKWRLSVRHNDAGGTRPRRGAYHPRHYPGTAAARHFRRCRYRAVEGGARA